MPIDINDLWIGDLVILAKSGREGKFSGKAADGRARIAIDQKILLVPIDHLSLKPIIDTFPDHLLDNLLEDISPVRSQSNPLKIKVNHTIDLHIDKLNPEMTNNFPGKIIEFQLAQCKIFIEDALGEQAFVKSVKVYLEKEIIEVESSDGTIWITSFCETNCEYAISKLNSIEVEKFVPTSIHHEIIESDPEVKICGEGWIGGTYYLIIYSDY